MAQDPDEAKLPLKSVTFKLSERDMERLRSIMNRRYPEDAHKMAQTLREIIREEDERGERKERHERTGK